MKMGQCSKTSAHKIQTPGNYPEESIQHNFLFITMPTWTHKAKCLTNVHMHNIWTLTDLQIPKMNFYCHQLPSSKEQTLLQLHDSVNISVPIITAHHS